MMWVFTLTLGALMSGAIADTILTKAGLDASASNNAMGRHAFKVLAREGGNVVFCPLSAQTVLALTYTGARGKTAEQMATAMQLSDFNTVSEGFKEIATHLNKPDEKIVFRTANKLYPANDIEVFPQFIENAQTSFLAEIQNLDFTANAAAAQTINEWVEVKTNKKIRNLVSPDALSGQTRMVIVNAVYFLGNWKNAFTAANTDMNFRVNAQRTVPVPQMYHETYYGYKEDPVLNAQILEIPYKNEEYSLIIILPRSVDGLAELEQNFDFDFTQELPRAKVSVSLPKFKIEKQIDVKQIVQELGMKNAFTTAADFSGISKENVFISDILQKVFIEVDEKGTEAAAATFVSYVPLSASINRPKSFVADRPFLFVLRNTAANVNLFMGRLYEPSPV